MLPMPCRQSGLRRPLIPRFRGCIGLAESQGTAQHSHCGAVAARHMLQSLVRFLFSLDSRCGERKSPSSPLLGRGKHERRGYG